MHVMQEIHIQGVDEAIHLTVFSAWDSSPNLPVTPTQLMRPDQNMSYTVGDFA